LSAKDSIRQLHLKFFEGNFNMDSMLNQGLKYIEQQKLKQAYL